MARHYTLELVVPGLLGPVPESVAEAPAAGERYPALERLLSRGRPEALPVFDPFALLACRFSPRPEDLAAGPVGLLGAGGDPGERYWYRVDPVHLRADRDRLMVFGPAAVGVDGDEAREIAAACNELLQEDGLELIAADGHWYLGAPRASDVVLASVYRAAGHYMDAYLPAGTDARKWNGLLSELQMLLHGLAVNGRREEQGRPTVNGFWPWGGGWASDAFDGPFPVVHAEDDFGRGLAALTGADVRPLPLRTAELEAGQQALIHDTRVLAALSSGDAGAWLEAVAAMENDRFADLLLDLRRGRLQQLRIVSGCGRCWTVTPGALRRFWRRDRAFRHWIRGARGPETR